MSLTTISPLIRDWMRLGLKWTYHWEPRLRPFTIEAKGSVQLPYEEYIFKASEGVLLTFAGVFDHPKCGIRLESPQLDTRDIFTVENLSPGGAVDMPFFVFVMTPPHVNYYIISNYKEWAWTDWARLYVFNTDDEAHTCIGAYYTIAMLKEPRPIDIETSALFKLAWDVFPNKREQIKEALEREVSRWLRVLETRR